MVHLSLSQNFLVLVPKLAVRLQLASPLSPPFSPLPQHLASLQPTIILALICVRVGVWEPARSVRQFVGFPAIPRARDTKSTAYMYEDLSAYWLYVIFFNMI
jgi:hypothetical protein